MEYTRQGHTAPYSGSWDLGLEYQGISLRLPGNQSYNNVWSITQALFPLPELFNHAPSRLRILEEGYNWAFYRHWMAQGCHYSTQISLRAELLDQRDIGACQEITTQTDHSEGDIEDTSDQPENHEDCAQDLPEP
jgi:hypothetical protein